MLRRPTPRIPVLVLVLAIVGTAVGGCGGGGGDEADGPATDRFGAVHAAICRAATQAESGDVAAAQDTFDDHHAGLHDLAAAAEREDRAVAARLLEVKQRVESDLGAETLRALVDPVGRAVEVTGGTAPEDCP